MKRLAWLVGAAGLVLVGAGVPTSLQPDGTTIVSNNAVISCATATTGQLGCVKPDGATITINGSGVISSSGGSATSVTVGTTTVGGATSGNFLYDNAGLLGQAVIGSGLTFIGGTLSTAAIAQNGINANAYLVCDGSTDNATNIANWQTAIAASPGKTGYIPPQTSACLTSANLQVVNNETIWAVPGTVIFKPTATSTANPLLFNAANISNVLVYGITFDGNLAALSSGSTALTQNVTQLYSVSNVVFDHVTWQNTRGLGLEASTSVVNSGVRDSYVYNVGMFWQTSGSNSDQVQGLSFSNGSGNLHNFIINTRFNLTGLDAINAVNQTSFVAANNIFYQVGGRTANGGACVYANTDTDLHITGNQCDTPYGNGYDAISVTGFEIAANSVNKAGGGGVQVSSSKQGAITGNKVLNSNQAGNTGTSNTIDGGIVFGGSISAVSVTGNVSGDTQGTPTQQSGIEFLTGTITTTCTSCQIDQSNVLSGNAVGPFAGGAAYTISDLSADTSTTTNTLVARSLAARGSDVFNVKDYGALGTGTATTIGTTYGASLSAVAGYTTAAGATPFSWMTNAAYGLTFSMSTSAAQGSAGTVLPFSVALSGNPSWSQSAPQFNSFWPANQQYFVLPGMSVSGSCIQAGTTVASTAAANNGAKLTSVAQGSAGTTLTFLETVGLVVGQPVSGTNIPSNTTIASLTGTTVTLSASTTAAVAAQAFIQFGEIANITLSQATSSACASSTSITFTLSNSQVQALTFDYLGLQSAFAAASANNGGHVIAPAGIYEINRPVWNPGITNANTYQPAVTFHGAGMYTTQITPTADFGAGACAMGENNRSGSVTGYAEWGDFRLVGVGTSNTTGGAVAAMDGLCVGAKALVRRVSAWQMNAGLNVLEDHQIIEDSDFGNNFYGIYMAPNGQNIGNQRISKTPTIGNAKAGIAAAWNNGLVSATLSDSDTGGNGPYSFYQEAIPYGQTAYAVNLLGYSVIQNMLGENVGNAYIYCEGNATTGCIVNNNTFIGGQPVVQLSSSSSVRISGLAPRAVVYVNQFLYNNLVNADFSNVGANFALVSHGIFEGEFEYNSFGDQTPMMMNLSATIPAMVTDNFGLSTGNSYQNTFAMGLSSGEFRAVESSVTAGEVLTYGTNYNYSGAIPMLLGYQFQPMGVALVAAASNTLTPVVEKGLVVVNKTTGTAISKGFAACVSAVTPTSVTACGAGSGVGLFTMGSVVVAAASGDTTVSIDVQILFNGQLQPFTVSTLPSCSSTYKALPGYYVTDATTPTYNGTLTGGGTGYPVTPVICDGTNWRSH